MMSDEYFYLNLARAVIHHTMLGSHFFVGVQTGGVKGNLRNTGNAANAVGLAWTCGLILILPVTEELFEQCGLTSSWHNLDLIAKS